MKVLLIRLESPLLAFGGIAVDNYGVIDTLPSASLLTGLVGNALGYRRVETERLQRLQDRLRYVVRVDRSGVRLRDFQTAQIAKNDKAWTTRGIIQSRAGGTETYRSPHLRYRDYHADAAISVAMGFEPADEAPDIDSVAIALDAPARPLFIGRKPCVPSTRIAAGVVEAESLLDGLRQLELADDADVEPRCFLPATGSEKLTEFDLVGRRNWHSDVHQGVERWREMSWHQLQ